MTVVLIGGCCFVCHSGGKTRTKDKYRVVYTDQQRLELEKEFQSNRYITMKRKTELSMALGLSERQVRGLECQFNLSRAHSTSTQAQKPPCETTFKFTRSRFLSELDISIVKEIEEEFLKSPPDLDLHKNVICSSLTYTTSFHQVSW